MKAPKRREEAETPGHNLSNSSRPWILLLCRSVFARVQVCALVERSALQGGLSKVHLARVCQLAFLFLLYLPAIARIVGLCLRSGLQSRTVSFRLLVNIFFWRHMVALASISCRKGGTPSLWGRPSAQYHFQFSSSRCLCFEERLSASLLPIVPFWRLRMWDGYKQICWKMHQGQGLRRSHRCPFSPSC